MASERVLENRMGRSGVALGGGCAVLFGLPFLAVGVGAILFGLGVIHPQVTGGEDMPPLVIVAFGSVFALAGAFMWTFGLLGIRARARQRRLAGEQFARAWFADYPWDITGITDRAGWKLLWPRTLRFLERGTETSGIFLPG